MTNDKKKQAVVETKNNAIVNASEYAQYAGQGFENHTKDDYAVPFLGLLQTNSPLCTTHATARAGMLVNTVTQDVYDGQKGIVFIPSATQHTVIEWKPDRGGFVAMHDMGSELVQKVREEQEFGKWKTQTGNDLTETFSVYGICVHEDGTSEQMIISFSSTKIKTYKRWMAKARTIQIPLPDGKRINPPLFAHKYRITSLLEKNAKGSFFNFSIGFDGEDAASCRLAPSSDLFQEAYAFAERIRSGEVKAAHDSQTGVGAEPADGDIPFGE